MVYKPQTDCVCCAYGDGAAVLDVRSNIYFTLDEVGATVWNILSDGADLEEIVAKVTEEYDVSAQACRPDIETFLGEMVENDLVVVMR